MQCPHLLLLQPPQSIADVLDVLRGQRYQSCVSSAQIHELQRREGQHISHSQQSWSHRTSQCMTRTQHLCPGKIPSVAPLTAATPEGRDVATHCMLHNTGAEGTLWSRTRGGCSTLTERAVGIFNSTRSRQGLSRSHPKDAHAAMLHGALVIYLAEPTPLHLAQGFPAVQVLHTWCLEH